MAAQKSSSSENLINEFEKWQEETSSEAIFLLEVCLKYEPMERNSLQCMPSENSAIADELCNVVKLDHDHIFCSMGRFRVAYAINLALSLITVCQMLNL